MKETLGEKLKRLLGGKKGSGNAAKTAQIQPDILDIALQDQLTHEDVAVTAEPVVLQDISEEGPRFSSEDLAQMSEGSWKLEGEPAIEDLFVEMPEIEEVTETAETVFENPLLESMEEDSAAIEELTSQMDSMAFFNSESEEPVRESEETVAEEGPERAVEEITETNQDIEEQAEETPESAEEIQDVEEVVEKAASEDSELTEKISEAETEEIATEDEISEPVEEDSEETEDVPETDTEPAETEDIPDGLEEISEEVSGGAAEEIEPDRTEEVSEKADELNQEETEAESGSEELAEGEAGEEAEADAEKKDAEENVIAEELTDLWGLNRTQEEIEKEETQDWLKRHIIRAAVWLILFGLISSGAYAYEKGWRINLFYEIQHTSQEETVGNGRKKRPDSSEFIEEDEQIQVNDDSNTGEGNFESKLESLISDLIVEIEDIKEDLKEDIKENNNKADNKENNKEDIKDNSKENSQEGIKEEEPVKNDEPEKEFVGITVSNETDPAKISGEGPTGELEHPDQVTVEETGPIQTVEVERAVNYYLSADGAVKEIRALPEDISTVQDLLDKAKVKLSEDDIVEPSVDSQIPAGDTVKVTRILYQTVTENEAIPGEAIEKLTPVLRSGRTYAINPDGQADGEKEVTYKEKYVNGVLESREEISSVVTKDPTDYILLVGASVPASPINGAQYTDIQILGNAPAEYSAVYSGRCTAYNFKKGAYGASGMYLSQGMVAVDPNLIPYGSLLYITNGDGSFVYGWAIACDYCEASAAGDAVVDLFFDTYRECTFFGARSLNVYVVKQLTQSELSGYIAKEGMFRSRVPA